MGRDFRIEEVNGGYIIRAWEPLKSKADAEVMYDTMKTQNEVVVATKAEAKDFMDKWLNGDAPPFKKEEEGK